MDSLKSLITNFITEKKLSYTFPDEVPMKIVKSCNFRIELFKVKNEESMKIKAIIMDVVNEEIANYEFKRIMESNKAFKMSLGNISNNKFTLNENENLCYNHMVFFVD